MFYGGKNYRFGRIYKFICRKSTWLVVVHCSMYRRQLVVHTAANLSSISSSIPSLQTALDRYWVITLSLWFSSDCIHLHTRTNLSWNLKFKIVNFHGILLEVNILRLRTILYFISLNFFIRIFCNLLNVFFSWIWLDYTKENCLFVQNFVQIASETYGYARWNLSQNFSIEVRI